MILNLLSTVLNFYVQSYLKVKFGCDSTVSHHFVWQKFWTKNYVNHLLVKKFFSKHTIDTRKIQVKFISKNECIIKTAHSKYDTLAVGFTAWLKKETMFRWNFVQSNVNTYALRWLVHIPWGATSFAFNSMYSICIGLLNFTSSKHFVLPSRIIFQSCCSLI